MYMSPVRKKSSKDKYKNTEFLSNADLQTPLHLATLETPNSISSITCSPSDLTHQVASLQNVLITSASDSSHPNPTDMDSFDETVNYVQLTTNSKVAQPPDHQGETPRYSRTEALKSFSRTFSASKKLQQMMGLQDPEPFVTPPSMPKDLELVFIDGLQEHGMDCRGHDVGFGPELGIRSEVTGKRKRPEKSRLPDITEEMESPSETTFTNAGVVGMPSSGGLGGTTPVWPSRAQAAAAQCTLRPFASYESGNGNDNDSEDVTLGYNGPLAEGGFDSSITLAESQSSRPGSPTIASRPCLPPNPGRATVSAIDDSFACDLNYSGEYDCIGVWYRSTQRSTSLSALTRSSLDNTSIKAREDGQNNYSQLLSSGYGNTMQRSAFTPVVLFPSPRLEHQSWGHVEKNADFTPIGFVPDGQTSIAPLTAQDELREGLLDRAYTSHVPQIQVQSPSPKKMPMSKKRASSLSSQELSGPPQTRARAEDSVGLPLLPDTSEALWKFHFSENTHALLTILLTWSITMRSMYNSCPNPKAFSYNTSLPWPVTPPIYQQLVSVGFYDMGVTPHQEIRFLGPGDVSEIIYGEVDTFRSQEDLDTFRGRQKQYCKIEAMRKAMRLATSPQKAGRYMASHQRAATGEGRWAYILIKGHQATKDGTPPHLMIAFHTSAVTDESMCLHTIFPDDYSAPSPPPQSPDNPRLKRIGSLQNIISASRNPRRLHHALRSASSSEISRVNVINTTPQVGAYTLQRTVLKMEKAGGIPLIEGYRVDVGAFRGWLDAVGRGSGKLMMWKER